MRQKLLIYGAGKLGRQIYYHLTNYYKDSATVEGFIDDIKAEGTEVTDGVRCLGGLDELAISELYPAQEYSCVFGIGYSDMTARQCAYQNLRTAGYKLFSVVHPRAVVEADAVIGQGSIILGGSVIDQGVVLGDICYVDIGVTIGEDSVLGSNNFLSSASALGGSVVLGDDNFIGMNSTIVNDIEIGSNVFINAQTLVRSNIEDNSQVIEIHKVRSSAPLKKK